MLKTAQATRCLWSSLLLKRREAVFSSSLENCFNESRGLIEERLAPNKLATFFFYHLQLLNYLVPRSRNVVEADERGWWSDGWLDVAEKIRWGLLKCKSYHDSISRWKNNYRNVSDHLQLVNLMDKVQDMLNTLSPRNTPPRSTVDEMVTETLNKARSVDVFAPSAGFSFTGRLLFNGGLITIITIIHYQAEILILFDVDGSHHITHHTTHTAT